MLEIVENSWDDEQLQWTVILPDLSSSRNSILPRNELRSSDFYSLILNHLDGRRWSVNMRRVDSTWEVSISSENCPAFCLTVDAVRKGMKIVQNFCSLQDVIYYSISCPPVAGVPGDIGVSFIMPSDRSRVYYRRGRITGGSTIWMYPTQDNLVLVLERLVLDVRAAPVGAGYSLHYQLDDDSSLIRGMFECRITVDAHLEYLRKLQSAGDVSRYAELLGTEGEREINLGE